MFEVGQQILEVVSNDGGWVFMTEAEILAIEGDWMHLVGRPFISWAKHYAKIYAPSYFFLLGDAPEEPPYL